MDTLRGTFDSPDYGEGDRDPGDIGDEGTHEPPPAMIGSDERRMQVRAYNHWAGLLADRNFPSIEDLSPAALPDFGPYSVLLDFTAGIENPAVQYLGAELAAECGADGEIGALTDVPARSLLSRITDHYMQILANQAPIGFEAEFVNQRGATILYRGILLPFSSDDDTIDFIYGVINWKEIADQHTTDELMLEIDQALDTDESADEGPRDPDPVTDWADGPVEGIATLRAPVATEASVGDFPAPAFGEIERDDAGEGQGTWRMAAMIARQSAPKKPYAIPLASDDEPLPAPHGDDPAEEGLVASLAAARACVQAALSCEDRSRGALYDAVGRAYDFSLAAEAAPGEFEALVAQNGLKVQERAPMTPVVKLVFGADYDKTRLTEYAAVLGHAHRLGLARGTLASFLGAAEGGLKGVVKAERKLRREESGKTDRTDSPRTRLASKLRAIEPRGFEAIAPDGAEFGLVVIRRVDGDVAVIGEVSDDPALIERVGRKLVA
ncbi:PAS domain-containing protein [Pelagerythrobacter aerophilus]